MAKFLLLKHYRGGPAAANDVPMDQWTPAEVEAHIAFMQAFATRLEGTGEFVDAQALSPDGMWVRSDGEGRPPVTDGPFAETKDLIAGWMVIDVDTEERALVRALSAWVDEVPANPRGWLVTVAWRAFLDMARADASRRDREVRYDTQPPSGTAVGADDTPNVAERDHQTRQAARVNQEISRWA